MIELIMLTEGRLRAGPENALSDNHTGDVLRFLGDVPPLLRGARRRAPRAIALMA